ncbi:ubiquitin carboxyl-terminal hydrolase 36 isoform X2 [Rhipicephalus sanguineus]|uniref:ubiquitin carboxyl-terminal hydrolase 36 isoform X2 n=1 Tax=Rhipicephalus sanguineus TaxID=34632 RepID=UPI0020C2D62E|nr:ubiquitin carboxyl-terminal hydrolase 36 isoform X2 [Rhipicephalus sanguineus]
MPQESLKMISNSISMGLGRSPLGLNQQVAGGSRSSVLLSRVDFEPGDGGGKLSTEALRAKYSPLSPSPVHNGQLSKNNSLHKIGGKVMVNGAALTNGVGGGGDAGNKVARRDDGCGEDGIPEPRVRLHSSDSILLDWREQRRIGAGLINMGNTCFMNTVIQCLTYCPPLANYLLHQDDHCTKCKTLNFCMMCELQRHMKRALEKSGDTIKPLYIYQRLKAIAKHFQFGQQEDAHEFLRYVIDNLWKAALANYDGDVKLDPASKETTVVNEIFGGYHRSQVTCMKCKEKSNTYDHFMDLILDIKNASSLETALEKFVEPELLQNDNAYKCPRCNIKVMAQKRFTVHRAPNVATFQLKRFDANRMFGGKITKHVSYPEHLELRPFMSDKHGDPVTYRLNAVLVHLGASCNSGHYFCFVRNSNGSWYCMDDSRVHQVSLGQVLNQQAYVLFYVRTPSESQENHIVKKSNSVATLCSRTATPEPIRNGQLSVAAERSTPQRPKQPPPRSPSSPAAVSTAGAAAASSSSSVATQPSPHRTAVATLPSTSTPLPDNRPKIAFGIGASSSSSAAASPSPSTSQRSIGPPKPPAPTAPTKPAAEKPVERPVNKPLTPLALGDMSLVPYAGDSSDASDSDRTDGTIDRRKGTAAQTHASDTPRPKGSSTWQVSDVNLLSPAISVESSTTSVNSTTDWNVTDKERPYEARKPVAEEFPGWTVEPAAASAVAPGAAEPSSLPGSSRDAPSKHVQDEDGPVVTEDKDQQLRPFLGDGRVGVVDSTETQPSGDGARGGDALSPASELATGHDGGAAAPVDEPPVRPVVPPPNSTAPAPIANGCVRASVTADTDDSSDSHEWVERTKETLAAERRHSSSSKATVHKWDARPSVNGSREGSLASSHWNGSNGSAKRQADIVGYLQSNGSRQYGYAVNGWRGRGSGGGGYHNGYGNDRGGGGDFYRDKRKHYDDYESYDAEYDKGKQKRTKNGFSQHSGSHYRNGSNPFQEAHNFRNQQGGGGHRFHHHQFHQRFQKGPPPFYARHHHNNNRQHSNYGPPRRKHHYSRTR